MDKLKTLNYIAVSVCMYLCVYVWMCVVCPVIPWMRWKFITQEV